MAAKRPTVGLNHPTVVPANFDPERDGLATADDEDGTRDAGGTRDGERSGRSGRDGPSRRS